MMNEHVFLFVVLATLWSLPWKAWALWLSARRTEKWWFLALLIVNTFAILEIIYIFFIAKRHDHWDEEVRDETSSDANE